MNYEVRITKYMTIIDANNLAGKLNLLKQEKFDQKLIGLLMNYKPGKYVLIFDGRDNMGDKYQRGNITVIHTPRDSHYKSADDKIIELAEKYLNSGEGIKLVTDDLEIIEKVKKIINERGGKIIFEKASAFAGKLAGYAGNTPDEKNLPQDEIDDINQDLLNIWK